VSVTLALPKLFDDVVARMTADAAAEDPPGEVVPQVFGWREPPKTRETARRIVWVPGTETGSAGRIAPARNSGRNPRSLATLVETFHVYVEAVDDTDADDERRQYQIARELFDAWYRAAHLAAHATFGVDSITWVGTENDRNYGAALLVVCHVEAAITDAPLETVDDAAAVLELSELNVTEPIESASAP
jgi:hypothetical protein